MNYASIWIRFPALVGMMFAALHLKFRAFLMKSVFEAGRKPAARAECTLMYASNRVGRSRKFAGRLLPYRERSSARAPTLASSKWWKEERHGVFLDYNQNAKDRTTCSAYSVRPLPDARVSTPLYWEEVPDCDPADFTIFTVPERFAKIGDPHAEMDASPGSLEKLLELADKDEAAGIADAPWPPHFRKMEGEAARVMPSRAKSAAKKTAIKKPRVKMPLITVANSPDKAAALAGLERWKAKHADIASLLAVDDVLVDSMRGRSSTWTRIRINLRHVPEEQRPPQETPEPDDDPTRAWRDRWKKKGRVIMLLLKD